ncbi:hypothetical protein PYCCODRAFT_730022 [Trametes coccinea BRFM310]|uniref:Uncharacterized protein n=1 Tax=Trametes coccinea (strain BRFM310) TaxID=1353009 RepID=A0A1Y2IFS3_TRAC3|nr:hypothetical protein PYCCODRAFT_730022 [Trametes coccinea BRFM310]
MRFQEMRPFRSDRCDICNRWRMVLPLQARRLGTRALCRVRVDYLEARPSRLICRAVSANSLGESVGSPDGVSGFSDGAAKSRVFLDLRFPMATSLAFLLVLAMALCYYAGRLNVLSSVGLRQLLALVHSRRSPSRRFIAQEDLRNRSSARTAAVLASCCHTPQVQSLLAWEPGVPGHYLGKTPPRVCSQSSCSSRAAGSEIGDVQHGSECQSGISLRHREVCSCRDALSSGRVRSRVIRPERTMPWYGFGMRNGQCPASIVLPNPNVPGHR